MGIAEIAGIEGIESIEGIEGIEDIAFGGRHDKGFGIFFKGSVQYGEYTKKKSSRSRLQLGP